MSNNIRKVFLSTKNQLITGNEKSNIFEGEYQSDFNLDEIKPMSWENLSELVDMGHIIGSNTKSCIR